MSTTPSMASFSIEEGTAHHPIFLSDALNTPVTVQANYLVELRDKEVMVMIFRTCQNMLSELFLNDIYVQICKLFCICS